MGEFNQLHRIQLKNGEILTYRETGKGEKTLLLIHGNMTSSKHWDLLADKLKGHFHIIAIDMRGFGGSTYHHPIDSLNDFAQDLEEAMNLLGYDSYFVAGWSTGGGVALELAANAPENVQKVILLESVGIKGYPIFKKDASGLPTSERLRTKEEIAQDPVQVLPVLTALEAKNKEFYRMIWDATIYTNNQPDPQLYEEYLEDMLTQRNLVDVDYALVHFNMTTEDNGVNIGTGRSTLITAPVLILQGDQDFVVPMTMAEETHKHLPHSGLAILKGCGHSPLVDDLPTLASHFTTFLG